MDALWHLNIFGKDVFMTYIGIHEKKKLKQTGSDASGSPQPSYKLNRF